MNEGVLILIIGITTLMVVMGIAWGIYETGEEYTRFRKRQIEEERRRRNG